MTQTHLHLLITHLPIFGSILGGLVLAYGLWTKSNQTKIAAYFLLIVSSLGAAIAYFTGEEAEEFVEDIQGFSKNAIEEHSDFALFALISLIVLGVFSIAGMFFTIRQSPNTKTFAQIILFVSIISFGLVARTGYLGGQIRHTELNPANASTNPHQGGEDEDKD